MCDEIKNKQQTLILILYFENTQAQENMQTQHFLLFSHVNFQNKLKSHALWFFSRTWKFQY